MYCLFRVLFPYPPSKHIVDVHVHVAPQTSDALTDSTKFCKVQCSCSCKNLPYICALLPDYVFFSSNCYFHSHFDASSQFDLS